MKVEEFSLTEKELDNRDGRDAMVIKINGTKVFSVHDGEPEDNTLSRNFNDCWSIVKLIRQAYEAGKKQEGLFFKRTLIDEL